MVVLKQLSLLGIPINKQIITLVLEPVVCKVKVLEIASMHPFLFAFYYNLHKTAGFGNCVTPSIFIVNVLITFIFCTKKCT